MTVTDRSISSLENASLAARIRETPSLTDSEKARTLVDDFIATAGDAAEVLNNQLKKLKIRGLLEGIAENSPFLWNLVRGDLPRFLVLLRESPEQHFSRIVEEA